jgi:ABC-type uncharacterized transport system permease subunit
VEAPQDGEYHHSLAVAVLFVVAVAYLAWWGVIGYRSWA